MSFLAANHDTADESDELVPRAAARSRRVAPEILRARRAAVAALVASGLAFAVVAVAAVRTFFGGAVREAGASQLESAQPDAVVGLVDTGVVGDAIQDLVDTFQKVTPIHPAAHRIKVQGAALYLERSPIAAKYRDLPQGSTVFPLKTQGGWCQVVVPEQGGQPAAMGWMPALHGIDTVLAVEYSRKPDGAESAKPQATQKDLHHKWGNARKKNGELKVKLKKAQKEYHRPTPEELRQAKHEQAKREVKKLMGSDTTEAIESGAKDLRKGVDSIKQEVKKELEKGPAKELLNDVGKFFK